MNNVGPLKAGARRFYQKAISRNGRPVDLQDSAIVFSPHFDDETLGCGGTIIRKKQVGADVKVVFMTDGSKGHPHLISEEESRKIRQREGIEACKALGLSTGDVTLLNFEETKLAGHVNAATEKVEEILARLQPAEIFIPYYGEPLLWSEDHLATTRIVKQALRVLTNDTTILEYPIWFWCHWPWAALPLRRRRHIFSHVKNHSFVRGLNLLRDFKYAVRIAEVLELKRAALLEHKSQMTRLIPTPRWRTLADVASGEFLECFFHEYEVFYQYVWSKNQSE